MTKDKITVGDGGVTIDMKSDILKPMESVEEILATQGTSIKSRQVRAILIYFEAYIIKTQMTLNMLATEIADLKKK